MRQTFPNLKHNKIHIKILNKMELRWECGIKTTKKEEQHLERKSVDR